MTDKRSYIAIDLKSFYASVECRERGLDPLTTNLVVADVSRTEKTICLAVSPSLKAYGISGRARLFEVVQRLREVNYARRQQAPGRQFAGQSVSDTELKAHPELEIGYIAATPRMAHYKAYSKRIYEIYLRYVSPEDIHVYSVDEVFCDVTPYLASYKMTAHQLAMTMIRDVLRETGITATAGIGTNLYLAKVAMDIVAKHMPADSDGVRIAELDETAYREQLWDHRPLTSFWRVGGATARKLEAYGMHTMGDVARCSVNHEALLYRLFGVNAELLIDHAWGWEPCTMAAIKAYRPETSSLSSGQVLSEPYDFAKAKVVMKEMADALALDLVDKRLVTDQIVITIGYDRESLIRPEIRAAYRGPVGFDHYGRQVPRPAHGSQNLMRLTASSRKIIEAAISLFDSMVNPNLLIRRLNIVAARVLPEQEAEKQHQTPVQLDMFADNSLLLQQQQDEERSLAREHRMQETLLDIKKKFGKNAILRALDFAEGATARQRNSQIGGHRA